MAEQKKKDDNSNTKRMTVFQGTKQVKRSQGWMTRNQTSIASEERQEREGSYEALDATRANKRSRSTGTTTVETKSETEEQQGSQEQGGGPGTFRSPAMPVDLEDEDASLGGGGGDDPMQQSAQSMSVDSVSSRTRSQTRRRSLSSVPPGQVRTTVMNIERKSPQQQPPPLPGKGRSQQQRFRVPDTQSAGTDAIRSLEAKLEEQTREREKIAKELANCATLRDTLQRQVNDGKDVVSNRDTLVDRLKEVRKKAVESLTRLHELKLPQDKKERIANDIFMLENAKSNTDFEKSVLIKTLDDIVTEFKDARMADDQCREFLKACQEQAEKYDKDLRSIKGISANCAADLQRAQTRIVELESELEKEKKAHVAVVESINRELVETQSQLDLCVDENADLKLSNQEANDKKDQKIQELTDELEKAEIFKNAVVTKVLGKKSGTIQMVVAAIDKQSSTLDTANNRIRQLEDEISKLVVRVPTDEQRNAGTDMVLFQQQPRPSSPDSKRGQLIPAPGKDVVPTRMTDDPLDKCQDALRDAKAKLTDAEDTISRLRRKVEKLSAQLVASTKAHDDVKTSFEECESKQTEQEDELGRLKSQKSALEGTLGAKEREIREQAVEIGRLKAGSLGTVAQRDIYEGQLAAKDGRIKDLEQGIQEMKAGIQNTIADAIRDYNAAQDQYDAKLNEADKKIKALEATNLQLQGDIKELRSLGNTARGNETKCEEQLQKCNEELERLRKENKELEDRRAAADRQANGFNLDVARLNGLLEPLQMQVADYEQKLQTCSRQLSAFQGDRRAFESKNQALLNQLNQVYQIANEQQIDVKRLREALDQGEFQRNIQQQLLDNKSKDARERLQKGSTTACNWLEDAMERIHRMIPSVQSPAAHDGMLLFYIHALCAEQHWGYLTARYMGNNYSMLYPLADQIALLLYEEYILETPDPDALFSKTTRHNVIRVLNAFMRVFHYHKAANDMRKETKNSRAVLRPAAVKHIFDFEKVPDMTNRRAYALEMRKDIMRAHKVFFELDLDTSEPKKPVGWNTFFSFGAARPDLPGTILNHLHNKDDHRALWNTIKLNKNLYRYWRYDVSSPLVLLLPMWDLLGEYSGRPKRN
jgi:hypothetical protein